MKKLIALILVCACLFILFGCKSKDSDISSFETTVSYANWAPASEIYIGALNIDKMVISSVRHLPIYKLDTLEELQNFKSYVKDSLSIDQGYDEVPSFNKATARYDEAFFDENTLMLVYVEASSGSFRYGVDSIYCDEDSFCVHVKQLNDPEICTEDMAGWFITVAVPDSMIADCKQFDADFNISLKGSASAVEGNMKIYYEMSDGTWQCDGYAYKYRLEISGRMPNAVKDTTYVYLSNIEDISFQKAMLASGVSSNTEDYFAPDDAVLVEMK